MTQGRMTYDLRRLRLHGLIERLPGTHRYQLTEFGLRLAFFYTRTYARLLRPGLSVLYAHAPPPNAKLNVAFKRVDDLIHQQCAAAQLDPKT